VLSFCMYIYLYLTVLSLYILMYNIYTASNRSLFIFEYMFVYFMFG
jgi:hypothetical protein